MLPHGRKTMKVQDNNETFIVKKKEKSSVVLVWSFASSNAMKAQAWTVV